MKRTIAVMLAVVMLFSCTSLFGAAQDSRQIIFHTSLLSTVHRTVGTQQAEVRTPSVGRVYDYAFIGWSEEENGTLKYDNEKSIIVEAGSEDVDLYPVWEKLILPRDEILPFNNSAYYFNLNEPDENGEKDTASTKYYMNKKDKITMLKYLFIAFPMLNLLYSVIFSTFPTWKFVGSCYGLSTVTALNHLGKLDFVSRQEGVKKMIDIQPTPDIISAINFYQFCAGAVHYCENKGFNTLPALRSTQLKKMYESVEKGNLVQFTYYENVLVFSAGHTILLVGSYTNTKGEHILLAYDNRNPNDYYQGKYNCKVVIDSDYSDAYVNTYRNEHEPASSFTWLDDFSCFDSFNINGGSHPIDLDKAIIRHLLNLFS